MSRLSELRGWAEQAPYAPAARVQPRPHPEHHDAVQPKQRFAGFNARFGYGLTALRHVPGRTDRWLRFNTLLADFTARLAKRRGSGCSSCESS